MFWFCLLTSDKLLNQRQTSIIQHKLFNSKGKHQNHRLSKIGNRSLAPCFHNQSTYVPWERHRVAQRPRFTLETRGGHSRTAESRRPQENLLELKEKLVKLRPKTWRCKSPFQSRDPKHCYKGLSFVGVSLPKAPDVLIHWNSLSTIKLLTVKLPNNFRRGRGTSHTCFCEYLDMPPSYT